MKGFEGESLRKLLKFREFSDYAPSLTHSPNLI